MVGSMGVSVVLSLEVPGNQVVLEGQKGDL